MTDSQREKFERDMLESVRQQNEGMDSHSPIEIDEQEPPYDDSELRDKHPEMNEEYWSKRKGLLAERSSLTNNEIVKPSHYRLCGEDSMPLIEKILGTEGYLAFLKGNVLKYRIRCGKKKGQSIEKDVAKAMYYEELYDNFVIQNQPS